MADRGGQQLDNYRLTRLLGAGGFGEVYLAEHIYRATQVAIKILPQLAQDDLHSFLTEARTFRLKHPNIVQVLDFGVEGGTPFIVMEYAPNGTLRQRHPKGTRVPLPTIVSYVKQVASALQYAHDERMVHRDVKPDNMLIGTQNQVLLSDFGIATIAHGTSSQSVETMAGTMPYMAPEQIQTHPRPASDQYSLGVVVYEWLCGDRPFHGTLTEVAVKHAAVSPPPLKEKIPTISPNIEQVVMTALAKDAKQRFGSVLAFAAALEQASQLKQPEPVPLVPISETTNTNQSQQPAETATPVLVIPFSQQAVSIVSTVIPTQPHSIIPLSGKERLRQIEEEMRRQAQEEKDLHVKEQGVRKAWEQEQSLSRLSLPAITGIPQGLHQRQLSWRKASLLLTLALLILGSAGGLFALQRLSTVRTQAIATANAQASVTGDRMQATIIATADSYARFVAKNGIMFGFDAQHSHANPYEQILDPTTVRSLTKKWSYSTGDVIDFSSPAVAGGVVFIGSQDGNIYALDATSGTKKWAYDTGNAVDSSPAVANGVVFIGSQDGNVYALDATSGTKKWAFHTGGVVESSPEVAGGVVFIGSDDHNMYAFHLPST